MQKNIFTFILLMHILACSKILCNYIWLLMELGGQLGNIYFYLALLHLALALWVILFILFMSTFIYNFSINISCNVLDFFLPQYITVKLSVTLLIPEIWERPKCCFNNLLIEFDPQLEFIGYFSIICYTLLYSYYSVMQPLTLLNCTFKSRGNSWSHYV